MKLSPPLGRQGPGKTDVELPNGKNTALATMTTIACIPISVPLT
jgi:hypothetical protein